MQFRASPLALSNSVLGILGPSAAPYASRMFLADNCIPFRFFSFRSSLSILDSQLPSLFGPIYQHLTTISARISQQQIFRKSTLLSLYQVPRFVTLPFHSSHISSAVKSCFILNGFPLQSISCPTIAQIHIGNANNSRKAHT